MSEHLSHGHGEPNVYEGMRYLEEVKFDNF
jgi:hypothetical protein